MFQSARAFEQTVLAGIMCRGRKTVAYEDVGEVESSVAATGAAMENATTADRSGDMGPRCPIELLPSPLSPAAFDRLLTIFEFRRLEEVMKR